MLSVVGIGVAAYLASIETTGSEAVCGPVGDCNAVQESEYAEFLGIPIGVLGVIGYWSSVACGPLAHGHGTGRGLGHPAHRGGAWRARSSRPT